MAPFSHHGTHALTALPRCCPKRPPDAVLLLGGSPAAAHAFVLIRTRPLVAIALLGEGAEAVRKRGTTPIGPTLRTVATGIDASHPR